MARTKASLKREQALLAERKAPRVFPPGPYYAWRQLDGRPFVAASERRVSTVKEGVLYGSRQWPGRLFRVEGTPTDGFFPVDTWSGTLDQVTICEEYPAHEVFGPNGALLIDQKTLLDCTLESITIEPLAVNEHSKAESLRNNFFQISKKTGRDPSLIAMRGWFSRFRDPTFTLLIETFFFALLLADRYGIEHPKGHDIVRATLLDPLERVVPYFSFEELQRRIVLPSVSS